MKRIIYFIVVVSVFLSWGYVAYCQTPTPTPDEPPTPPPTPIPIGGEVLGAGALVLLGTYRLLRRSG